MMNRAAFLRDAARAAVASAVGLELLAIAGCAGQATPSAAPNVWRELAHRLQGPLVRPGDSGFTALALPNNLRYDSIFPSGIAMCQSAQDVSTSIGWAREFGVPLVARSGGHSYGGYSTTTGLMIDVSTMNSLTYDAATGIATLGGGCRNSDVYRALRPLSRAITHGRCLGVGIAGLTLGGGIGFNMRAHGVTCDQLIDTQIVTADGALHAASASQNADLLWASRGGGGGNFGINTQFRFQTFAVDTVTIYQLEWHARQDDVFAALVHALETAPDTMGAKISLAAPTAAERAAGKDIRVVLLGQLVGTPAQLAEILLPVYRIARPTGFVREVPYWTGQDALSEAGLPEFFHESSRFFDGPMSDAAIAIILDGIRRWPGTTEAAAFKLFQTGGVMNAPAPSATAFVHRSSEWLSSIGLVWDAHDTQAEIARGLEWQKAFYDAYIPYAKGGAYQNFIDPSLAGWKQAYYGTNLARLESIKAKVDPNHVFAFAEAVP